MTDDENLWQRLVRIERNPANPAWESDLTNAELASVLRDIAEENESRHDRTARIERGVLREAARRLLGEGE